MRYPWPHEVIYELNTLPRRVARHGVREGDPISIEVANLPTGVSPRDRHHHSL